MQFEVEGQPSEIQAAVVPVRTNHEVTFHTVRGIRRLPPRSDGRRSEALCTEMHTWSSVRRL